MPGLGWNVVHGGGEEAVTEEFGERFKALDGQQVEAALAVEEPAGGQHVEVGVKDEVVAGDEHAALVAGRAEGTALAGEGE